MEGENRGLAEECLNENFQNINVPGLRHNRAETEYLFRFILKIPQIFPRLTADTLMGSPGHFGEMSLRR